MPKQCVTCGKEKGVRYFRQVTARPATYSDECLACLAKEDAREQALANREYAERKQVQK